MTTHFQFGGKPICFKRHGRMRSARVSADPKLVTCGRCKRILQYKDLVLKRRIRTLA